MRTGPLSESEPALGPRPIPLSGTPEQSHQSPSSWEWTGIVGGRSLDAGVQAAPLVGRSH